MTETVHSKARSASIAVLAAFVLTGLLFFPTTAALNTKWTYWTAVYSHGWLIVALSAWLCVRVSRGLHSASRPDWRVVLALAVVSLVWFVCWLAGIFALQALLLMPLLFLALVGFFGLSSWRAWVFPVGFLLFAMPVWEVLTPILQQLTVAVSTTVLRSAGIVAYIDGSDVYLAAGTFRIEQSCAGLHFFIVALVLSTLYGQLFLNRMRHKLALVAAAVVLAVVMNWTRVTTIIVAGYLTDMQHYLVTVDHFTFGWVLFVLAMIPFYLLAVSLEKREAASAAEPPESGAGAASLRRGWLAPAVSAAAALAAGPLAAAVIAGQFSTPENTSLAAPAQIGEWRRVAVTDGRLGIDFGGSLAATEAVYQNGTDDGELILFANVYGRPRQGAELISSGNKLYDTGRWSAEHETVATGVHGGLDKVNIVRLLSNGNDRRVMAYWYVVGQRSFADAANVKLAELAAVLTGKPGSGLRVLSVSCRSDCEAAEQALLDLLRNMDTDRLHKAAGQPG